MGNTPTPPHPMVALIKRAAEGDRQSMRQLVTALTPAIRGAVASVLARSSSGRRAPRQEVDDITQSVLLALFADRGRVLQQWEPARGTPLEAFVSLLAKRETASLLRSRRRSPWTEQPTEMENLDQNAVPRMGPESEAISRDMLANLAEAVHSKLSPKGRELFELMFMRGLPPEEVSAQTGLTLEAVYAWKSRLSRQVKEILSELARIPPTVRPPSNPGLRDPTLETLVRAKAPKTPSMGIPVTAKAPTSRPNIRRGSPPPEIEDPLTGEHPIQKGDVVEKDDVEKTDPGRAKLPTRRGAAG